jgi:hypothetical protein
MANDDERSDWQAIIARSLAFLCLQNSEVKNEKISGKAKFLKGLGLSTADAAAILDTTPASIYELFRQARKAKGGKGAPKKGKTARR